MIELVVRSGSAAGRRQRFETATIALGRHPECDLRFDTHLDRDVSLRHARIRRDDDQVLIEDLGSTNGTYVNGVRIEGATALHDGDEIALGAQGPRIVVRSSELTPPAPRAEGHHVPAAAATPTASRIVIPLLILLMLAVGAAAYLAGRASAHDRERELLALTRRTDSLVARYGEDLATMVGQVQGLDSALRVARSESEALRTQLLRARSSRSAEEVEMLSGRLDRAELQQRSLTSLTRLDYSSIAEQSGRAVVLIAVEDANGRNLTGSGFSVSSDGYLITNRHLVQTESGRRPRRIAVIFSETSQWLPARVVNVSERQDLALLQVETQGPFPRVAAIARTGSGSRVGSPVAIIGYPLGTDTPMGAGAGPAFTARYTLGAGTLSKALGDVLQIDAFAGEGSSGSPVFDPSGRVIAVIYGGARESAGRIVYAVPSDLLLELLPPSAGVIVR